MKDMVEEFLCIGCTNGSDTTCGKYCFEDNTCKNHRAGTFMSGYRIVLGLPKGFNRIQEHSNIYLYSSQEEQVEDFSFDLFNLPVWVYEKDGFLFINVYSPRVSLKNIMVIKNGKVKDIVIDNSARDIEANIEEMSFNPILLTKSIIDDMG